ncbi:MAG: glycosyltransferase family 2 protein [Bacteroidetes bacterium]|nr:glycosyltransferase family 2 protein [Bacteroidota bacterium]
MSSTILTAITVIQLIFFIPLALAVLYIFIYAFAGLFYRQAPYPVNPKLKKIAVLIPGYKEDDVIMDVAHQALEQDYPQEFYDVVIIADSFQPQTIVDLKTLPIKVIEVKFDKSTKSKALNKAMEQLRDDYEIAVVLDADNVMARDFLQKVNATFELSFYAVQCHRKAKNMETSLATLDAISEEINNHIFRKGHRVLGLSSAIIGSGMAFRYQFFKNLMSNVTAIGGFDKEIELKMLKDGYKIAYLDDAAVFDEKVQKAEVFSNQRRRWLSAQLIYFRRDFLTALKSLITKGNIDYFDKAIQFIQPPRILLLGMILFLGTAFIVLNLFLPSGLNYLYLWALLIALCIAAFIFSIPTSFYNLTTLKAIGSLPKGMLLMLGSLLKIKGANKQFIHTKHTSSKVQIK